MTWTDPRCADLDARCAAQQRSPYRRVHAYRELKRARMEETAARMRAQNAANQRRREAALAWRRRLRDTMGMR